MTTQTIYVQLLDEGTDCWRPVKARLVTTDVYEIIEQEVPEDEIWEFLPGTKVYCEVKLLSSYRNPQKELVAIKKIK